MKFKGTKGRWVSSFQTGSWIIQDKESFQDDSKSALAEVYYFEDGKDTAEANALLISKAPEMLEMLKECYFELQNYRKEFGQGSNLESEIEQLIKEATELQP